VQANPEFLSPGREDDRARDLVEDHAQELCDTHALLFSTLGTNALAARADDQKEHPQIAQIDTDFSSDLICGNLRNLRTKRGADACAEADAIQLKGSE